VKLSRPARIVLIAIALDGVGGLAFAAVEHLSVSVALYWAVSTATTVGYGDVTPHTTAGHIIAVLVMMTVIPLFAATFSLLTSGLTVAHVHRANAQTLRRLDHLIAFHPDIPALPEEKP
jgi:voltage-gated potassium channel